MILVNITESNLYQHPQVICFINPKHPAYHLKVDWLKERFREGSEKREADQQMKGIVALDYPCIPLTNHLLLSEINLLV